MTQGPGFLPHLVEFAVEYGLPVSDNDWENVVGPLYYRLSLKANKWSNIKRYWQENLQNSSDGCRNIRDILLLKKNGIPFTHPCSRINYNNNAATSATAIQGLQETIQGLQETIQGLRETIQDLQQHLAISNGANANVTMAVPTTDALTNDYEEEESQERELAASIRHSNNHKVNESIITNAAAEIENSNNRTGGNNEDGSLSEQVIHNLYTHIPKCKVEELYSDNAAYRGEGYLSIEHFSIQTLKPLGKGEFSQVYCARGPVGNRVIALKVLSKDKNPLIGEEIQIHYALPHHSNILRMHYYFAERDIIYLVLEFASGNSLYKQKRPFSALTSARYISEVCSGLIHCHQHRVMHRDMKMENLMLGSDGQIKIIDFGLAKSIDDHTNTFCGTPVYQAPEILLATSDGPKYDQRVDVWATGVLLYEFLFYASDEAINQGTTPFRGNNDDEVWESILNSEICWPEEGVFSKVSIDLISRLLVKVPSERISLDDVLTHDFLLSRQNDHDGDDEYDVNSRGDDE